MFSDESVTIKAFILGPLSLSFWSWHIILPYQTALFDGLRVYLAHVPLSPCIYFYSAGDK